MNKSNQIDLLSDRLTENDKAQRMKMDSWQHHGNTISELEITETKRLRVPPIESLNLSNRTFNSLKTAHIDYVYEIYAFGSKGDFFQLEKFGELSFSNLNQALNEQGFPTIPNQENQDVGHVEKPLDISNCKLPSQLNFSQISNLNLSLNTQAVLLFFSDSVEGPKITKFSDKTLKDIINENYIELDDYQIKSALIELFSELMPETRTLPNKSQYPNIFDFKNKNSLRNIFEICINGIFESSTNSKQVRKILLLRKGQNLTLEQTGSHFGVTRERIRQIEKKFLTKKLFFPYSILMKWIISKSLETFEGRATAKQLSTYIGCEIDELRTCMSLLITHQKMKEPNIVSNDGKSIFKDILYIKEIDTYYNSFQLEELEKCTKKIIETVESVSVIETSTLQSVISKDYPFFTIDLLKTMISLDQFKSSPIHFPRNLTILKCDGYQERISGKWIVYGLTKQQREIFRAMLYAPIESGSFSPEELSNKIHLENGIPSNVITQWVESDSNWKTSSRNVEYVCERKPEIFIKSGPTSWGLTVTNNNAFTEDPTPSIETYIFTAIHQIANENPIPDPKTRQEKLLEIAILKKFSRESTINKPQSLEEKVYDIVRKLNREFSLSATLSDNDLIIRMQIADTINEIAAYDKSFHRPRNINLNRIHHRLTSLFSREKIATAIEEMLLAKELINLGKYGGKPDYINANSIGFKKQIPSLFDYQKERNVTRSNVLKQIKTHHSEEVIFACIDLMIARRNLTETNSQLTLGRALPNSREKFDLRKKSFAKTENARTGIPVQDIIRKIDTMSDRGYFKNPKTKHDLKEESNLVDPKTSRTAKKRISLQAVSRRLEGVASPITIDKYLKQMLHDGRIVNISKRPKIYDFRLDKTVSTESLSNIQIPKKEKPASVAKLLFSVLNNAKGPISENEILSEMRKVNPSTNSSTLSPYLRNWYKDLIDRLPGKLFKLKYPDLGTSVLNEPQNKELTIIDAILLTMQMYPAPMSVQTIFERSCDLRTVPYRAVGSYLSQKYRDFFVSNGDGLYSLSEKGKSKNVS